MTDDTPRASGVAFPIYSGTYGNGVTLALQNGNFFTAFPDAGTGALHLQVFNQTGAKIGPEFQPTDVNVDHFGGAVLSDGRIAIVYSASGVIWEAIYNQDGSTSIAASVIKQQGGVNWSVTAVTALQDGRFVVTENRADAQNGGLNDYAQVINANGTVAIDSFYALQGLPNGTVAAGQLRATQLSDGKVLFYDWDEASFAEVGVTYSPTDFTNLGTRILAPKTLGFEHASVSVLANGNFVAVYTKAGSDGSNLGLYGQVFQNDGTAVGAEFKLPDQTMAGTSLQTNVSIQALPDGGFVVGYRGSDGPETGGAANDRATAHLQRYNNDGTRDGSLVTISLDHGQASGGGPELALLNDGQLLVVYPPSQNETGQLFDLLPLPDLSVAALSLNKSAAEAGDTVNVSYLVRDLGGPAGASTSKIYISTNPVVTSADRLIGTEPDPMLAAGNSVSDTIDVVLPADLAAGTYYIAVIADAGGVVTESDETNNGSTSVAIQVSANSLDYGSGQTASNLSISSGQTLSVFSGGAARNDAISSGGQELDYRGGVASSETISAGGQLYAFSSGVASNITLASGGFAAALNGGAIKGATVLSNAIVLAGAGGVVSGSIVSQGGYELDYGGVGSGAVVSNGGAVFVAQGGSAVSDAVLSGGTQEVLATGVASGTVVSNGGLQLVLAAGTSISATLSAGGTGLLVNGYQNATVISNNGFAYVEGASGVASADVILAGGVEDALFGGTASGTIVSANGILIVGNSGFAKGAVLSNGGYEIVVSGGVASGEQALNGGLDYIEAGAVGSGGTVSAGGVAIVLSGGTTFGITIASNGVEVVSPGGIASNSILSTGGYEVVFSGATAAGATLTSGGVLIVNSGGSGSGAMNFVGVNNEIIVNSGGNISGATISGFHLGDYIDLKGLGFTGDVTSANYVGNTTSGVLTVTSGAQSVSLNLLGQYVTANFTLANDGAGGTLLGDPPVSSGTIAPQA